MVSLGMVYDILNVHNEFINYDLHRVKLAVHRDTRECVAVKIVDVDDSSGLTHESLRKEVCIIFCSLTISTVVIRLGEKYPLLQNAS